MTQNPTCLVQIKKRKERFIPHSLNLRIFPLMVTQVSNPSALKFNSPSMTTPQQKRLNPGRPKPLKTLTQTRNAGIGHQMKINDIIGSSKFIISISLTSTCEEQIEYLNRWPISSRREKHSNVEAIIRKCRKSTNIFQKF